MHAGMPTPPDQAPTLDQALPLEQAPPESRHPPGADPPGADIPPDQVPPLEADCSNRLTSGRYASYWNAFLFTSTFSSHSETASYSL